MALNLTAFALLAASPLQKAVNALTDDTFKGIHRLDWFDWSLLVPYFTVMAVLSIYGAYRYEVIRGYLKGRKNLATEPSRRFEQLPRVTVQLPLYNESYVAGRLLEGVTRIDYPRELLQIQVLDDSTDDTQSIAASLVARYQAEGHDIQYIHRDNRAGFKAGALQEGLKTATGELIAIFDADFVPPADFLARTVHFFTDPAIGVVQSRWTYLNREYNVLTEIQAMLLDGHFVLDHVARCGRGLFINFNGTAGVLRRRMIEDAGGWQHDTLTEDCDLSYRAQLKGWRFIYVPALGCPSELPVEMHAFQVQQSRWAKGLTQTARKLLPSLLRSPIPWRQKMEAVFHLTPNISYPLMLIISALMVPVMIVRFYIGWWQILFVDLPLMTAAFFSISAFYLMAEREHDRRTWKRSIFMMPALLAAGVALAVINTRAVVEGLLGIQSSFVRTAKYAIGDQGVHAAPAKYRRKSGWLPYIELAIGTYFLGAMYWAIGSRNFAALPLLALFVAGYYWAAIATLCGEYGSRMRWERRRRALLRTAH
ncbi:MAG: glycosyltransferase [Bryobacterales bacterium]|nr:glycosyltransferase [Bryobacterales bacterium]